MNKLKVYYVDSFTTEIFKGNPAAVIIYENNLSIETMKKVAQELNLSETVFAKKTKKQNIFIVRYFTKTHEIDFCGHATLALAWILGANYNFIELVDYLTFKTNIGKIIINWEVTKNKLNKVFMKQVSPIIKPFTGSTLELCSILGIDINDINNNFPIRLAYTGNWDLLVPVKSFEIVKKIYPNMKKLKEHNLNYKVTSTHIFSFLGGEIVTRNFGPAVGIDEDPVTGSTTGALAGYFLFEKILPWDNHYFVVKQINSFNRDGLLDVKIKANKKLSIYVGGSAVCSLVGYLNIDKGMVK